MVINLSDDKVARDIGAFKAELQERIAKLTEHVIDQIYEITEHELTKIYPEKNWYEDNFGANLFSLTLQVTSQIQVGTVYRRAEQITEKRND